MQNSEDIFQKGVLTEGMFLSKCNFLTCNESKESKNLAILTLFFLSELGGRIG